MADIVGTEEGEFLQGSPGADRIDALGGDDVVFGQSGNDELRGGDGADWLFGGNDNDLLEGGDGADWLDGEWGVNSLYGGGGDDELRAVSNIQGEYVDGGDGLDLLTFSAQYHGSGVVFSLANPATPQTVAGTTVVNVERVNFIGSDNFADTVTGGAFDDRILGLMGDDSIDGAGGDDELDGGNGRNSVQGGGGDDLIRYGGNDLLLDGGADIDLVRIEVAASGSTITLDFSDPSADQTLFGATTLRNIERVNYFGGSGSDRITGGAYVDLIGGNAGDDILDGGGGDDVLSGGDGMDELRGGSGDDRLINYENFSWTSNPIGFTLLDGGEGNDSLELGTSNYAGPVTIDLADPGGAVRNIEQISFRGGSGVNTIRGGALDDLIWGGASNDYFEGRGGDDDLRGQGGNDVVHGGVGRDRITGESGADQLYGGDDDDFIDGGYASSYLDGGAGDDQLYAFDEADTLVGGDGNDWLSGGGGDDSMDGGAGDDVYVVDSLGDVVVENPGAGVDEIQTVLAGYVLSANFERLGAASQVGLSVARDFRGNAGDNRVSAGGGNDLLRLNDGGNDDARGFGGNDVLYFGGGFTGADVADGGADRDVLVLQGNYNLTLSSTNMAGIESLSLQSGAQTRWGDTANDFYDYDITMADSNTPAGVQLIVNAQSLRADEDFTFDGSAESDGRFLVYAGHGVDDLTGGDGNDVFFFEGQRWGEDDVVDGGDGRDSVIISSGSGLNRFVFGEDSFANIEAISVNARFVSDPTQKPSYELVLANGNVVPGGILIVNGNSLTDVSQFVHFNGSAVQQGNLFLFGGASHDTLTAGGGADLLLGASGADALTGGAGADTFRYDAVTDSVAGLSDVIGDFLVGVDKVDLSRIDANSLVAGDQAFAFIGSNAFSNTAGELRIVSSNGFQWAEGDVNGDGAADLVIGFQVGAAPLSAGDFVL